jgi:hypothetical protein
MDLSGPQDVNCSLCPTMCNPMQTQKRKRQGPKIRYQPFEKSVFHDLFSKYGGLHYTFLKLEYSNSTLRPVFSNLDFMLQQLSSEKGQRLNRRHTADTKMQLPRRPPPLSLMYTGASVLVTHPGRRCLPLQTLTYLSVHDNRDVVSERVTSRWSPSSLIHVHRWIGSRNETRQTLPTSSKLTSLSMYDRRNGTTQCTSVRACPLP